jgi:hypothetical protein
MSKLITLWNKLLPEWRFAIGAFVIARLALFAWSLVVYAMFPVAQQNLDLFGEPLLTVFNLRTSERYVYSRDVDGTLLTFQAIDSQHVVDEQTNSVWSNQNGDGLSGTYAGKSLADASHLSEDIFPYLGVAPAQNIGLALWQRFDANWYLKIAARGYDGSDGSTVYFPLYPMLIRVFSWIMDPLFAALLISNIALIGVLVLLYRLASKLVDVATTRRALAYLLMFPTAFFLMGAYTESLFLLFTLGNFHAASQRRWVWAALWGACAALTRLQGVLLLIPLLYMLWRERKTFAWKEFILRGLPLALIPLSTFSFLAYSNLSLFNTYQGTLNARFVFPWENIWAAVSVLAHGEGAIVDALNLIVTLGSLAIMVPVWKKLPLEYTLYALLMLIAPMFRMTTLQPLVSMSRYAVVIFPMFIILGMWGEKPWVNRLVLYTSVLLQLYLSAQFILWGWVA